MIARIQIKSRSRFRTIQTAAAVTLPFPVHPRIRLAQLSENAPAFGVLPAFRPESALHLQGFCPNMLVGTAAELQTLAEQVDLGIIDLSCVDHAVVVLTRCGQPPITDVARVVLWQVFGVPVFELFVGPDGAILGYECELHEGWHLASNVELSEMNGEMLLHAPGISGLHTGISGYIVKETCPCGREGSRLLDVQPAARVAVNQPMAATA